MKRFLLIVACAAAGSCRGTATPVSSTSPTATPPAAASCTPAFELDRDTFDENGGQTAVTITAASTCGWQITLPEWMAVTPSASGIGSATLALTVKTYALEREATVSIGEQGRRVRQRPVGPIEPVRYSSRCGQGTRGALVIGACVVGVSLGSGRPSSSGVKVASDLRAFGLPSVSYWVYITASAGEFEIDFRIPSDFPIGPVDIPVEITDAQGRVVNTTVVFRVVG